MGIPPSFSDLGKATKDLFEKNFHFGIIKAEHKSKTSTGIDLTTSGTHTLDSGKITGSLEGKYKCDKYGIVATEKWTTSNVVSIEIAFENLMKGLRPVFEATFEPNTGKRSAKSKVSYKRDSVNANVDLDFQESVPNVNGGLVLGYKGYLVGANLIFDSQTKSISKIICALGYQVNDFAFISQVANQDIYSANVYQRLSDKLESALSISWAHTTHATKFGVCGRYQLDNRSFAKFKFDNNAMLGLAYSFQARDGLNLTFGAQIDSKNLNGTGHKLGMGIEFNTL